MDGDTDLLIQLQNLTNAGGSAEEIIELIRDVTTNDLSAFQTLYPPDEYRGSIARRMPASAMRNQMHKAAAASVEKRLELRAERQTQVRCFLADKGENLSLAAIAKLLNESDIKPAQGGAWTRTKVFRLMSDETE